MAYIHIEINPIPSLTLDLPIRANHKVKGPGYIGMMCDRGTHRFPFRSFEFLRLLIALRFE